MSGKLAMQENKLVMQNGQLGFCCCNPCRPPWQFLIVICNANGAKDDNFSVRLNGTTLGTLDLSADAYAGGYWKSDAEIPAPTCPAPAGYACDWQFSGILSPSIFLARGLNNLHMVNVQQNNNGNWGTVQVFVFNVTSGIATPCGTWLDTSYSPQDGDDADFTF